MALKIILGLFALLIVSCFYTYLGYLVAETQQHDNESQRIHPFSSNRINF